MFNKIPGQVSVTPPWSAPVEVNFAANTGRIGSTNYSSSTSVPGFYFSNSSGGTSIDTGSSFGPNTPRRTASGLLVETASTNLALSSDSLTNTTYWLNSNVGSVTSGQSDPFGGTTAFRISQTNSTIADQVIKQTGSATVSSTTGTVHTCSVYAKAGTYDYLRFVTSTKNGTQYSVVVFQFSTQTFTVGSNGGAWTIAFKNAVSIGGGWYRIILVVNTPSSTPDIGLWIGPSNNTNTTITGTSTNNIYVCRPQIEPGVTSASSYIPTTTAAASRMADDVKQNYGANTSGVIISCSSLGDLIYPIAGVTNYVYDSVNLSVFGPVGSGAYYTLTPATITSPTGFFDAHTIGIGPNFGSYPADNGITGQSVYNSVKIPAGTIVTLSAWLRTLTGSADFSLTLFGFNFQQSSPNFTATTQWQRFNSTFILQNDELTNGVDFGINGPTDGAGLGTGTSTIQLVLWGPQLELSDTMHGYVPTVQQINTISPTAPFNFGAVPTTNIMSPSQRYLLQRGAIMYNSTADTAAGAMPDPYSTTISEVSSLTDDSTMSYHSALFDYNLGSGPLGFTLSANDYTFSMYMKGGIGRARYSFLTFGKSYIAIFDLTGNGRVSAVNGIGTSGTISIGNGWYRCWISSNLPADTYPVTFGFAGAENYGDLTPGLGPSYVGTGDNLYLWGGQLETGSLATSYVNTYGDGINFVPVTGPLNPWVGQNITKVTVL